MRAIRPLHVQCAAVLLAVLVAVVYWGHMLAGHGPVLVFTPDSIGYAGQGLSLADGRDYRRDGGRSIGYPLLLAAAFLTPAPFLVAIVAQALLALVGLWLAWRFVVLSLTHDRTGGTSPWRTTVPAFGAVVAASYGGLHVLVQCVLTEVLFVALSAVALLATARFILIERPTPALPLIVIGTAVAAFANILVKPHWLMTALLLAAVLSVKLARLLLGDARPAGQVDGATAFAHGVMVTAACTGAVLALLYAVWLPDRILATRHNGRDADVFGARTGFCTHAHLIAATVARQPALQLAGDPQLNTFLRGFVVDITARGGDAGWRRLGFNADVCTFDASLSARMAALTPLAADERSAYAQALLRSACADPLPYLAKVLAQMWYGLDLAFVKYANFDQIDRDAYMRFEREYAPERDLLRGVTTTRMAGPFAAGKPVMAGTWYGMATQAVLAVTFTVLRIAFIALVAATLVLVPVRWHTWDAARRRAAIAFICLPLGIILSHNLLVAIAHSFDIGRYAFNMYLINWAFIGAASHFWWREWGSAPRPGP